MADASERERLIRVLRNLTECGVLPSHENVRFVIDMLRADAETIRSYEWCNEGLSDNALAFFRENIDLREQLAAQSAELATVKDGMQGAVQVATERGEEILRLSAELERVRKDKERFDAIAADYWKLDPFEMPTGSGDADVGWRIVQYHQCDPHERTVAEVYEDDPRKAIDAALATPSAADGYKEPSEAQMFGGDLYSGIKP